MTTMSKAKDMLMTRPRSVAGAVLILITAFCANACSRGQPAASPAASKPAAAESARSEPTNEPSGAKDSKYTPPTPEEMAPLRPEYLAELAKIHEPPEMAGKPMQVRKPVPTAVLRLQQVMGTLGSPEKATHAQRVTAIHELAGFATTATPADEMDPPTIYAAVATMACIDGADPQTVIEYANNAIGGEGGDALALRARMYLKNGERSKALADLEKIMADDEGHSLVGGDVKPRKESAPCGWSIADLDALGDDPRALAAKGLYLSSFIPYNADATGDVKESDIRVLYARSASLWRSPIPHFLSVTLVGFGSAHSMSGARCIRINSGGGHARETVRACTEVDEGMRQTIRELTMALLIDPQFAPALSKRASYFLELAQASYADRKPSRNLFELAIKDYSAALAAGGRNKHTLYCDRGIALASIGRYRDSATDYIEGMKYAKDGVEDSPFVYQQLAAVYMKLSRSREAADILTQGIMNNSGGGITTVFILGGMKGFRALYPEYDSLPDQILAEVVRRRFYPQFSQSWDADFISKESAVGSSILPDLYALRGDAYMKASRRADALADYRRIKSDAWGGEERFLPRNFYFAERGNRNYELPTPWPPPPPTL
jgi:tetratricopeptide (TPR) repeat protein